MVGVVKPSVRAVATVRSVRTLVNCFMGVTGIFGLLIRYGNIPNNHAKSAISIDAAA
jgi:hypothetical protein